MGNINVIDEKGNIKKIPYRTENMILKPEQLKFLYENFIIRCENDVKPLKYFYINSKEIKSLKENLKFELEPLKKGIESSVNVKLDKIFFLNDKKSTIPSLLFHIRNCFVHNRIRLLESGKIELFDVIPPPQMNKKELEILKRKGKQRPKPRITMYAMVSSFNKLKEILKGVINSQQ